MEEQGNKKISVILKCSLLQLAAPSYDNKLRDEKASHEPLAGSIIISLIVDRLWIIVLTVRIYFDIHFHFSSSNLLRATGLFQMFLPGFPIWYNNTSLLPVLQFSTTGATVHSWGVLLGAMDVFWSLTWTINMSKAFCLSFVFLILWVSGWGWRDDFFSSLFPFFNPSFLLTLNKNKSRAYYVSGTLEDTGDMMKNKVR